MDRSRGSVGDPAQHPRKASAQNSPSCRARLHPVFTWFLVTWLGMPDSYTAPFCPGTVPPWWPELHPGMTPAWLVNDLGTGSGNPLGITPTSHSTPARSCYELLARPEGGGCRAGPRLRSAWLENMSTREPVAAAVRRIGRRVNSPKTPMPRHPHIPLPCHCNRVRVVSSEPDPCRVSIPWHFGFCSR